MRRRIFALSILSVFALSACGVRGGLQKAPPMWGDKAKAEKKTDDKAPEKIEDRAEDRKD